MILHGLWIIEEEFMPEGKFFLWGEMLRQDIQTNSARNVEGHPYVLPPRGIR